MEFDSVTKYFIVFYIILTIFHIILFSLMFLEGYEPDYSECGIFDNLEFCMKLKKKFN